MKHYLRPWLSLATAWVFLLAGCALPRLGPLVRVVDRPVTVIVVRTVEVPVIVEVPVTVEVPVLESGTLELDRTAETPVPGPEALPSGPQLELLAHRGGDAAERFYYSYTVEGQVKNISDRTLDWVSVVVTLYDIEDKFLTSGWDLLEFQTLRPGEVSPFLVEIPRSGGRVGRYEIQFAYHGAIVEYVGRSE